MDFIEKTGEQVTPYFNDLGSLRIKVFREYPYLYDGSLEYEKKYLQTYFQSPKSYVVFCRNDLGEIVGASTGIALTDASKEFQEPFQKQKWDLQKVFYFGESVLDAAYRGLGIGKKFMQYRENFALTLPNITHTSFCSVIRPENHPHKPKGYRPLFDFWRSIGYEPMPNMVGEFSWKDIDSPKETQKAMQFWQKQIRK